MSEATQTMPVTGSFCWNELMTRDSKAALGFFTKLFGWTTEEMNLPHGTYTMLRNGETYIGGCMEMKGEMFEGVPPHWMSYVAVDDVDASAKKAESLGGTILVPPTEIPNMGRFSVIQDPTGAAISIWKGAAGCEG